MKAKYILKEEDIPEDVCDVCMLHDKADEILGEELLCPKCGHPLEEGACGYDGYVIVGETNGYGGDEEIGKYKIYHCEHCGDEHRNIYALMPVKIMWNANHDRFLTGGKLFLEEDSRRLDEQVKNGISELIEQYTCRIKDGEDLNALHLTCWIQGAVEHAVATYLYEHGYKR
jgi:hypothetical protein